MSLKKFVNLKIPFRDKEEGDIIDSSEWNENFIEAEDVNQSNKQAFDELATILETNASNVIAVDSLDGTSIVLLKHLISAINDGINFCKTYCNLFEEAGINSITNTITNNQFAIPTSKAVFDNSHTHTNMQLLNDYNGKAWETDSATDSSQCATVHALMKEVVNAKDEMYDRMAHIQLDASSADMIKAIYDKNADGKVNNADVADTLEGLSTTVKELNKLVGLNVGSTELNRLVGLTAKASEINCLSGLMDNIVDLLNEKVDERYIDYYLPKFTITTVTLSANEWTENDGKYTTEANNPASNVEAIHFAVPLNSMDKIKYGISLDIYPARGKILAIADEIPQNDVTFKLLSFKADVDGAQIFNLGDNVSDLFNMIANTEF